MLNYRSLFEQTNTSAYEPFDQLSPFQSTSETFKKWLLAAPANKIRGYENPLGPGSMILRIAHQDTLGLLKLIGSAVAKIDLAFSDTELQESALHWRHRLDEFRAILLDLEKSLPNFINFLDVEASVSRQRFRSELDRHPVESLLYNAIREIEVQKFKFNNLRL